MDASTTNGTGGYAGYPYDVAFQRKVLALMVREPHFLASYAEVIEPTYFEDEACAILARLVLDFATEHQARPPGQAVVAVLIADYIATLKMDNELRRDLQQLALSLYDEDLTNGSVYTARVSAFGRTRVLQQMTLRLAEGLTQGSDPEAMWALVHRMEQRGLANGSPGSHL